MIDRLINKRYRVVSLLGRGGMASVYQAVDMLENRTVAMKVLSMASNVECLKRFRREFTSCAALDHENIIKLYECDLLPDGCPYYTMQYLKSPSLQIRLERQESFSGGRVLKIAMQAADAMSYFHKRGVVHRDLKPGNILLQADNKITIVDFGLAYAAGMTSLTATGALLGTPVYMPPEVLYGEKADKRSDIYSLGVVLYELLTRRVPFYSRDLDGLFSAIVAADLIPPSMLRGGIERGWDEVCSRCLAREREDRYQSADELAADLLLLRKNRSITKRKVAVTKTKDDKKRRAADRRSFKFFVFPAVLCLFVAFHLMSSRYGRDYLAQSLVVASSTPDSIDVTWKSRAPYKSRVILKGGGVEKQLVSDGPPTRLHAVHIDKLSSGVKYEVRLLYPDGSNSLPRSIETGIVTIDDLSSSFEDGALHLRWKSNFTLTNKAYLEVYCASDIRSAPRQFRVLNKNGFLDSIVSGDLHSVEKLIFSYGPLDSQCVDMGKTLRRCVVRPLRVLENFDPRQIQLDAMEASRPLVEKVCEKKKKELGVSVLRRSEIREIRRRYASEALLKLLHKAGIEKSYRSLQPFIPLLFHTRLYPFEERVQAYYSINNLMLLSAYTNIDKFPNPFVLRPFPDLGPFAYYRGNNRPGSDERIVLLSAEGKGILFGTVGIHKTRQQPRVRLQLACTIEDVSSWRRAAVIFDMKLFKHFVMRTRVNDRVDLFLFGRSLLKGEREFCLLRQNIPMEALVDGRNFFLVTSEFILNYINQDFSRIKSITLELWK